MKRTSLIALFLVLVMLLCPVLASCGGGSSEETKAEDTKPAETEPKATEPAETKPAETEHGTEPEQTEPGETEPEETEPAETEPAETEPAETEPEETEPPLITVDVSGLKFESATIPFDGDKHTLLVSGLDTLPDGVTVAYKDNEASKVGEYKAKATFTVPEGYEPIAAMEATLTITAPTIVDGAFVFVDEEKTFLYQVNPSLISTSVAIPDGVVRMADYAVYGLKNLVTLYVPASVTEIGDYAFGYKSKYGTASVNKDLTVYGEANSAAAAFCEKNGITFKAEDPTIHIASVSDLYATDGILLWLDAFDPSNSTVDLANGKWYSKLDNTKYATLCAGSGFSWIARAKGIGYNLTQSDYESNKSEKRKCYLDLGESVVNPIGNFTIEFVGAMYAVWDGTSFGQCTNSNYDLQASTNRFGPWAEWIFNITAGGDNVRTSYINNNGYTGDWGNGDYITSWNFPAYNDRAVKSFTHVVTGDNVKTNLTTYVNGAVGRNRTFVFGETTNGNGQKPGQADPSTAKAFFIMRGTACTLMAVRVYDRALTKEEAALNHFADLCLYYDLDVSSLANVFKPDFEMVVNEFTAYGFDEDKETLQAAITKALAPEFSVTVTLELVDESGKSIAPSVSRTLLTGDTYYFTTPSVTGYYTRQLFVEGVADTTKTVTAVFKKLPSGISAAKINELLPGVVSWGDSITFGINKTVSGEHYVDLSELTGSTAALDYPAVIQSLIRTRLGTSTEVFNAGVGGETSAVIAARASTETYFLYLGAEAVLEGNSVTIDIQQYASGGRLGVLRQTDYGTINPVELTGKDADGNPVTVTGTVEIHAKVAGTDIMRCEYNQLYYTFTRTDGSTGKVTFAANTPIVNAGSYLFDGQWCTIFIGQNGGYRDVNELIQQQEEILKACECEENFIIVSFTSGSTTGMATYENAMKQKWGDHFISGRSALGEQEAYLRLGFNKEQMASHAGDIQSGTAAIGVTVSSDGVHLNCVGYALLGNRIFEQMWKLGYFDPVFDYYDSLQQN